MPKYKDLNGDGIINGDDRTMIGRGTPIHTGGFTNNFEYKGFDLNIFFQWSYGNDVIKPTASSSKAVSRKSVN